MSQALGLADQEDLSEDSDYVYICENNTIYGTKYKELPPHAGKLLVADLSSCILSERTDVSKYDLIFSNAALQWSDNHVELFSKLISKLNDNGQFAIQMPCQKENILNIILSELVQEQPYSDFLSGYHQESPLLSIDEYVKIMFDEGLKDLNISLRVYPIYANNETELYNFISGSALIPYMERLTVHEQELFVKEFLRRIKNYFEPFPSIYSFKRLLIYGRKK